MMRPRHSSPTGTAIGSPVSVTSWPRTKPSDVSIATVRTVFSPRCCATSRTRRWPPFLVSSAFRMAGRWSSNWTSTTAPMTWVIFPTALGVAMNLLLRTSEHSDHGQRDRHVVARGARIGANPVGVFDQRLDLGLVGAGNRDLQLGLEAEADLVLVHRDRAGDAGVLAVEAVLLGERQDRLAEAGRPAEHEKLLGIVALAVAAEFLLQAHCQGEPAVVEDRPAIAAAFGRRRYGVSHGRLRYSLKGLGAGDDLDQLLGDHRLARAVVRDGL